MAAVVGGLVVAVGQLLVAPLFEEDPPPRLVEQVVHSDACGDVAMLTSSHRADGPAEVRDALADDPGLVYCAVAITDDDELVDLLADGAPPAPWLPDTPADDPAAQQVERLHGIVRRTRGNA